MAHEHDRLGTVLKAVLDSRECADDSLGVRDLAILEWHIEINAHENALVLDQVRDPIDREFSGQHLCE